MTALNYQALQPTLTNVQAEMLKVFAMQLPDTQLNELRVLIARFLMDKARSEATTIWEAKGYNDDTLEALTSGTHE
jgi:hypothetical protein